MAKSKPKKKRRAARPTRETELPGRGLLALPMTATAPRPDLTDQELKTALDTAINAFETNRRDIMLEAVQSGDVDVVLRVQNEYQNLLAARYELIRRALDRNSATYEQLKADALKATDDAVAAIKALTSLNDIITTMAKVVSAVATIITVFGL